MTTCDNKRFPANRNVYNGIQTSSICYIHVNAHTENHKMSKVTNTKVSDEERQHTKHM